MAIIHFLVPEGKELQFSQRHPQPDIQQYNAERWQQQQQEAALNIVITRVPAEALPPKEKFSSSGIAALKKIYAEHLDVDWEALGIQSLSMVEGRGYSVIHGWASMRNLHLITDVVFNDAPLESDPGPIKLGENGDIILIDDKADGIRVLYPEYTQHLADFRQDLRTNIAELIELANQNGDAMSSTLLGRLLDMVDVLDQNAPQ